MKIENLDKEVFLIDDIVSSEIQNEIENLLTSEKFPWHYSKSANYSKEMLENLEKTNLAIYSLSKIENSVETPQFINNIFENSPAYFHIAKILEKIPFKIKAIMRIKANLTYAMPSITEKNFGVPHVDFSNENFNFVTGIYYVNDSDGDTLIFNERMRKNQIYNSLQIRHSIKPQKGRMVLFNGNLIHAGKNPTGLLPRIVINFNFALESL